MITYRNWIFFIIISLGLIFLFEGVSFLNWWAWSLIILIWIFPFVWGSYSITSGFYVRTLCSGKGKKRVVALTFDDGPDEKNTPELLELLEKYSARAAFFLIGKKIKNREELVKRIIQKGHLAANHSFSHSSFLPFYSSNRLAEDLNACTDAIRKAGGVTPRLFRPPFGVTSPPYSKALSKNKLLAVGWNVRSLDTVITDADKLVDKIMGSLKGEDIILLHDTQGHVVQVVEKLLSRLESNGIKVVPLDKLLNIEPYEKNI